MTQDNKDSLVKHLVGLVEDAVETTTPFYKDFTYTTVHNDDFNGGDNVIKCTDSNGNYNGKSLAFSPGILNGTDYYNSGIMLIDENMNILHTYREWNTGTDFNCFMGLNIDEEGKIYGIDYDPETQKYRFILMNNLSEPTKMPDGTLEYRAVLRNSWYIQGYTADDDISYTSKVVLEKSRTSAKYYFGFWDTTGQTLMPSTLEINVGESNTWTRLQDISVLNGSLLDYYVVFNSNETPTAKFYSSEFVYSSGVETDEKITKAVAVGDEEPTYETFVPSLKYLYDDVGDSFPNIKMIVKSDNWYFLILSGIYADSVYKQRIRVYEYKNGTMTKVFQDDNTTTISTNTHLPYINYQELDGTLYMYYGFQKEATEHSNNKLYFTMANTEILEKGIDFNINTNIEIYDDISVPFILISQFYLKKACFFNPIDLGEYQVCVATIMYGSGVDTTTFTRIDDINPTKGVLYDNNNKLMFARGLYNKKVYGNRTISILNVPNSYLNNINIKTGALLGATNMSLEEETLNVEKNIYENLFINYFNTLFMQDRNTSDYKDNEPGAGRINESVAKLNDYEDAKATKIRIHYDDGSTFIGGASATFSNHKATYKITIYVPEDKMVDKIEIISNDENTIYQTIYNDGTMMNTKYYNIYQDVYVS